MNLERRAQQIEDLRVAVIAADSGDFATDEEVRHALMKYVNQPLDVPDVPPPLVITGLAHRRSRE